MKKSEEKSWLSSQWKIVLSAVAFVAVIGIVVLITGKVQQSDPTLTQAPPPGPDAQTLAPSAQKQLHHGPMYVMTPAGPVLNQPGSAN